MILSIHGKIGEIGRIANLLLKKKGVRMLRVNHPV